MNQYKHNRVLGCERSENLKNIIDALNYIVKNGCPLCLKSIPVKKTFVYDTSCHWFTTFKAQIFFNAPWKKFMIILHKTHSL